MKYLLIILLSFLGLSGYGQLMQTNGTPGGYQFVALKGDSLIIIPRGIDTPAIGPTKYGKSTVGALFYKTTDSTFWVRSSNKWNRISGSGGGGGVQSVTGNSPIDVDNTDPNNPIISYTGDTTRVFIFESPIQALTYGDTIYVYFDSTLHHTTPFNDDRYYPRYDNPAPYLTQYDAQGQFVDSNYTHSGNNKDTLISAKNGFENNFYIVYNNCNQLIDGGKVSLSHDLTYSITPAFYRIGCVDYNSTSDSVVLSAADPDSARIDLIVLDTNGDVVVIEGTLSANPVEPQYDPALYFPLTTVYIPAAATTPQGVTVTTVYDENLGSPTEFNTANGAGLTVSFSNTTNPYHLTKDIDVSTWINSGTRTITFTSGSSLLSTDYSLFKMYLDLKADLASTANIIVRFYNGATAVTGAITLNSTYGFNKIDVGYQNITIPFSGVAFTSTTFNKIVITVTGAGGGMYIDWAQLQGGIPNGVSNYITDVYRTPGSTQVYKVINGVASAAFTDSVGTAGTGTTEYVVSGLGVRVDSSGRVYTVNVDTASSVILSRQRAAATYVPLIRTVTAGYGLYGGGALSADITITSDTFQLASRNRLLKVIDSLVAIIATKQATGNYITALTGDVTASGPGSVAATLATVNSNVGTFTNATVTVNGKGLVTAASSGTAGTSLNGTGYVKMSGTTPSYQTNTQLTADINTFTQTLKGAVPAPVTLNGYFLKDDGTWAAASGGSGIPTDSIYIRQLAYPNRNILSKTAGNGNAGIYGGTSLNPRNIGVSDSALLSITTGTDNIALGYRALQLNATPSFNIAIGNQTLSALTTQTSSTGNEGNIGIGYQALNAYQGVTTASHFGNIAIGRGALKSLSTTGYSNIAIGTRVMGIGLGGLQNTVIGHASYENGTGSVNTIIGYNNAILMTAGNSNTFVGNNIAASVTSGDINQNLFFGNNIGAGSSSSSGDFNTGIGQSLFGSAWTSASNNIVMSAIAAADGLTSGTRNIIMYVAASPQISSGTRNIAIGDQPKVVSTTAADQISIGNVFNEDALGRVYINTTGSGVTTAPTINASAQFTVKGATDKGVLMPVLTPAQINAITVSTTTANLTVEDNVINKTRRHNGVNWTTEGGTIYTATADKTVGNTVTETTLMSTTFSGIDTLAANEIRIGNTIVVHVSGYIKTNGAPTINLQFKYGSTVLVSTGATTLVSTSANGRFEANFIATVRTIGASGTIYSQGEMKYFSGATTVNSIQALSTSAVTVDQTLTTAGANKISVTATWGTADANNTITATNSYIELKN